MDIYVENLTKTYKVFEKKEGFKNSIKSLFHRELKEVHALNGINFEINSGEIVGFVGKNGSGKTTTMKILAGLLSPTSGKVQIGKYNPFEKNYSFLKKLGFVTGQKGQLRPDLPASDSFELLTAIYDINTKDAQKRIHYLAEELQVEPFLHQPVRLLSLGQRMKCELIASLIHSPSILLLDEPTLGLDFASAEAIRQIIHREAVERKTTVILSSHILDDIQEICNRMILIDTGTIRFNGSLDECFHSYAKSKILSIRAKESQLEKIKKLNTFLNYEVENNIINFEVPRSQIPKTIENIINQIEVDDITVKESSLGKVIESITNATP